MGSCDHGPGLHQRSFHAGSERTARRACGSVFHQPARGGPRAHGGRLARSCAHREPPRLGLPERDASAQHCCHGAARRHTFARFQLRHFGPAEGTHRQHRGHRAPDRLVCGCIWRARFGALPDLPAVLELSAENDVLLLPASRHRLRLLALHAGLWQLPRAQAHIQHRAAALLRNLAGGRAIAQCGGYKSGDRRGARERPPRRQHSLSRDRHGADHASDVGFLLGPRTATVRGVRNNGSREWLHGTSRAH